MMATLPDHVTYEVGIDESIHPDQSIVGRFIEFAMSDCKFGCKIYADPMSRVNVLAHSEIYGCKRRKDDILNDLWSDEELNKLPTVLDYHSS